ncbi:arsenite-transporting ATPase [Prescottella agglutinans]|uniref:Arsenite-transporting ATPase n=2 Tax=Prescottella agglutinans TaxID=1644129 RepID=A0ABT6M5P8_9NOCA|nr:arsenite-transporting ATPase [Prescottella agglutinans]
MAAATAVALAGTGRKVLLASLDQAHSLADVLGRPVGRGHETPVTTGLDAVEIDTLALLEERYRGLVAVLALGGSHDHGAHFADLAPEELTGLPGVEDLLGLGEIVRLAEQGRWDVVVVDCPPTADALRALALPETVSGYVERVWPQHRRVAATAGSSADTRLAFAVAMLDRVLDATAAVSALLTDRSRTAVRVVTSPERVGLAETRRVLSAAALAGLRVDAIVVNKLLPQLDSGVDAGAVGDWYGTRRAAQQDVLAAVGAASEAAAVLSADYLAAEPIGWDALDGLARAVYCDHDAVDPSEESRSDCTPVRVALESGSGDLESVYAMRMHLPLVDPGTLTLGRVEDDLLVGADGRRRRVRLASVLRRCVVQGADFDGSDLVVRFVPDPAVWPQ